LINNTSYQNAKIMLGTGAFDFLISMKYNNTETTVQKPGSNYNYSYGREFDFDGGSGDPRQIIIVKRMGLVELSGSTKKVTMEVILWL